MRDDASVIGRALDEARRLAESGRTDEARAAYLAIVARAPDDAGALNDFGTFLFRGGFRAAARTTYERALGIERSALAHANLANVLFADTDYDGACGHYEAALAIDPEYAQAHQGLAYALTRLGREDEALAHRHRGFAGRALTTAPYRGTGTPADVLLCVCAGGGTLYTDTFLDEQCFRTTTLVADMYEGEPELPARGVVFNAISDADRAGAALDRLEQWLDRARVPVLNAPARVRATARAANAARLAQLPGIVAPRIVAVRLQDLRGNGPALIAEYGFTFPLLVRAPGFHTGQHFARVDSAAELTPAIAAFPGNEVLLIEYVDVRDADANVRKYRVMAVDGVLYPMHLAIAQQWKVHYFTADMAADAGNRADDARFLADPRAVLGTPAWAALESVRDALGLEYAGIDFALDRSGRVVVFEANATMIVLPPAPDAMWDYRREPVERIVVAVRAMLLGRQ